MRSINHAEPVNNRACPNALGISVKDTLRIYDQNPIKFDEFSVKITFLSMKYSGIRLKYYHK